MAKRRPYEAYEDGSGFNPRTMGNRRSGPPVAGPAGPIGSHRNLILSWLAAHDRPRNAVPQGDYYFPAFGGPRDPNERVPRRRVRRS